MTNTAIDIEGLEATLAYIKEHPHNWEQGIWWDEYARGCFAGHYLHTVKNTERPNNADPSWWYVETATRLMGISDCDAHELFIQDNSLFEIELILQGIINRAKEASR